MMPRPNRRRRGCSSARGPTILASVHREQLGSAALLTLLGACLPRGDPSWLIDEPRVLALSMRVAEPGRFAPERAEEIAAGDVAIAMPGDIVDLAVLAVDDDGLPQDMAPAKWFACSSSLCRLGFPPRPPAPPCPAAGGPIALNCVLGVGSRVQATLPDPGPAFGSRVESGVMVVLPTTDDVSADQCVARLLDDERPPLWDCRFFEGTLPLGPSFALAEHAEELGLSPAIEASEYPSEIRDAPLNRAPVLDQLLIVRDDGSFALEGEDEITVRVGERVQLRVPDDVDGEDYLALGREDGELVVEPRTEELDATWWFSAPVEQVVEGSAPPSVRLVIPSVDRVEVDVVLGDGRGARSWLHVTLQVEGDAG